MLARIIERNLGQYFVITQAFDFVPLENEPPSVQVGDWLDIELRFTENPYRPKCALFIAQAPYAAPKEFLVEFKLSCHDCLHRLKQTTEGCRQCTPSPLK